LLQLVVPFAPPFAITMQHALPVLEDEFLELGFIVLRQEHRRFKVRERKIEQFKSWYGIVPARCSTIWSKLIAIDWLRQTKRPQPKHMLWALLFLRSYSSEAHLCSMVGGVDAKTFRKWLWFYLGGIARLSSSVVRTRHCCSCFPSAKCSRCCRSNYRIDFAMILVTEL